MRCYSNSSNRPHRRRRTDRSIVFANAQPRLIYGFLGLHESAAKQHRDQIIRFCRIHSRALQTNTYTDTQAVGVTSIGIGRHAMHVMLPNNGKSVR